LARRKRRPIGSASRRLFWALMAERRADSHELPTPRSISRTTGYRVHIWCKSCRHAKDADVAELIAAGRGDVPLVKMKWR
jgi:hypothetical protein